MKEPFLLLWLFFVRKKAEAEHQRAANNFSFRCKLSSWFDLLSNECSYLMKAVIELLALLELVSKLNVINVSKERVEFIFEGMKTRID